MDLDADDGDVDESVEATRGRANLKVFWRVTGAEMEVPLPVMTAVAEEGRPGMWGGTEKVRVDAAERAKRCTRLHIRAKSMTTVG